ncbi:MAG: phosphate-starvation-inducible [Proteobacteria bacterium]|nr:phosphate-starvation-inducible [Pseudomonadota bacterium]
MHRPGSHLGIRLITLVEYAGLLAVAIATVIAFWQEIAVMLDARTVRLADLLLMFIYLEVLAMVGVYLQSGQLPVRIPMYIGMVALARYMVLDMKEMDAWRMLAVAGAVLLLAVAVLVIRYGHVRFPYGHEPEDASFTQTTGPKS